jgi:hypothetical protein
MLRCRAPSNQPGTFFVAQSWADCITNMFVFDLRQAQLAAMKSFGFAMVGQSSYHDRFVYVDAIKS